MGSDWWNARCRQSMVTKVCVNPIVVIAAIPARPSVSEGRAMTERTIDAHERFAAEALLLRALHSYLEARQRAQEVGGDLSMAPELPVRGFRRVGQTL